MFSIFLIAVSLAMDAFSVSIILGSLNQKNKLTKGIISSMMFGLFQAGMPIIGWLIGGTFKSLILGVDHWIAFLLLLIIGLKMIFQRTNEKSLIEKKKINFKLLLYLALATSIDALIVGVGIAFFGVPILLTVGIIGLVTFLLSMIGFYLGIKSSGIFKNKAEIFGGIILIGIGIKILVEHLFF